MTRCTLLAVMALFAAGCCLDSPERHWCCGDGCKMYGYFDGRPVKPSAYQADPGDASCRHAHAMWTFGGMLGVRGGEGGAICGEACGTSCGGNCGSGGCAGGCESACGCEAGGYTPLGFLLTRLTCGGGCGELYLGEWQYDPPGDCERCDDRGNWLGPRCCGRWRPLWDGLPHLWGYRNSDCQDGEFATAAGNGVEVHEIRPRSELVPAPVPTKAKPPAAQHDGAAYYVPGAK